MKNKISIITPSYNSASTIRNTLESIKNQTYKNIEHIIIDGGSTDGTLDVIKKYNIKCLSEPDNGIYFAMNKGIQLSSGKIIGISNSDDYYAHNRVIESVVKNIKDCCWGDLEYIDSKRFWKSSPYKSFRTGWMPPHPTFFVKKKIYNQLGLFNTKLKISADYELMLRFLEKHKIQGVYIPNILAKMRPGGISKKILKANLECCRAWKINNIKISPLILARKPLSKTMQYFLQ